MIDGGREERMPRLQRHRQRREGLAKKTREPEDIKGKISTVHAVTCTFLARHGVLGGREELRVGFFLAEIV